MERVDTVEHTSTHSKPEAGLTVIKFTVSVFWHHNRKVLRSRLCRCLCKKRTTECQRSVSCVSLSKTTEEEEEAGGGGWYGRAAEKNKAKYLQSSHDIPAAETNFHKRV